METAFLIKQYKSSGMLGARPFFFKRRRIFCPVTDFTCGIPWESRKMTPIWDGVKPFFASLQQCCSTSAGVTVFINQDGGDLL